MGFVVTTERMCEVLKETNGLISVAAKRLGCDQQTIRNRAARVQMVRQVIIEARAELVDIAELSLKMAVMRGDPWAVAFVLRTMGKDRGYTEKNILELTGANGGPVELAVVERIVSAKTIDGRARVIDDGSDSRDTVDEFATRLLPQP